MKPSTGRLSCRCDITPSTRVQDKLGYDGLMLESSYRSWQTDSVNLSRTQECYFRDPEELSSSVIASIPGSSRFMGHSLNPRHDLTYVSACSERHPEYVT